ncbi:MAG: septum formation initiator family protein [Acidimicrobiales bacterium]
MPSVYRTRPPGGPTQSRAARRRAARRRRDRLLLAGSVVVSALVVAAWFPASALYHQHQELAGTTAQLAKVRAEDAALHGEEHRLGNPSEVARIAREQYQFVDPGQQAYEVLPASGGAGGSYEGDPGLQAPVLPSGKSELPPGADGSATASGGHGSGSAATTGTNGGRGGTDSTGAAAAAGSGGGRASAPSSGSGGSGSTSLVGRIAQTLEFWR